MSSLDTTPHQLLNFDLWHFFFKSDTFVFYAHLQNAQLYQFCNRFWNKTIDKDFYQTWGLINPKILRCYIIKAFYVLEVIRIKLKQQNKKKNIMTQV